MPGAHAKLSPSSAKRWMVCPGSVNLPQEPDTTSAFAEEGTVAHWVAEQCLLTGDDPTAYIGKKCPEVESDIDITDSMAVYVSEYLAYCKQVGGENPIYTQVEGKFEIISEHDIWGTSDYTVMEDEETLHVVDLKYGQGVQVYAEGNEQLMLYAYGALQEVQMLGYNPSYVRIHIAQPRKSHWDYAIYSSKAIENFIEGVRKSAEVIKSGDKNCNPGEWCKWCKATLACSALKDKAEEYAKKTFEDDWHNDISALSEIYRLKEPVENFLKSVESKLEELLLAGQKSDGVKLIKGRPGNRKWNKGAEDVLGLYLSEDVIFDAPKLLSPSKMEKLLKAEKVTLDDIKETWTRPEAKPKLALSEEKGVEWEPEKSAQEIFGND